MDLERAIKARHMVRSYSDRSVSTQTVRELLDLARRAPSAGNTQAISFVVLTAPRDVARYWNTSMPLDKQKSFRWQSLINAPALVMVVTNPRLYPKRYSEPDKSKTGLGTNLEAWPVPFWWVDAGAVVQNILLLATAQGLGACLFGTFDHENAIKATFEIPADHRIAATIAIGYPQSGEPGRSANRTRPDLNEVVHHGVWGAPDVPQS